jgi:hypothetical protein
LKTRLTKAGDAYTKMQNLFALGDDDMEDDNEHEDDDDGFYDNLSNEDNEANEIH